MHIAREKTSMRASAEKEMLAISWKKAKIAEADSLCAERTAQRDPFFAAKNRSTLSSLRKIFAHCQTHNPAGKKSSAPESASESHLAGRLAKLGHVSEMDVIERSPQNAWANSTPTLRGIVQILAKARSREITQRIRLEEATPRRSPLPRRSRRSRRMTTTTSHSARGPDQDPATPNPNTAADRPSGQF